MKNLIIITIIILAFTSCEKEKINNGHGTNMIVVQGYLYAGQSVDSIRLSQTVLLNTADTLFHGITNAIVTLSCNGSTYPLTPSNIAGFYHSDASLKISAGQTYTLKINYNNDTITSQTFVPTNPTALQISDTILTVDTTLTRTQLSDSSLLISWSNPNKDYYFVILRNTDTSLVPITVTNTYGHGGYFNGNINYARSFRSRPIQDSLYRISLFATVGNYGKYEFKLYKVTKDYASLYQSSTQNSINLNEPFTNINNGLGIFTAFSVCDSLFFKVVKKE
jgi:hypothetical protein